MAGQSPPVGRRLVGYTLRRYREQLGYGLEDAAQPHEPEWNPHDGKPSVRMREPEFREAHSGASLLTERHR
jgi:hypothetical protein